MNRRRFLEVMGGAGTAAVSLSHVPNILAAQTTTPFYVKGLVMISFEDQRVLRLGLPKAPGHKGTLSMAPQSGRLRSLNLKGTYTIESAANVSQRPEYKIPELIRMQELYGNQIRSRVNECPAVISIPYAAIESITATEVSPSRYTFVRADTGQEVPTFRPRKVAETLRIDLSSDAAITLAGEKVKMNTLKEVRAEYSPDAPPPEAEMDAFTAHFPHYLPYLNRPATANFDVIPRNLDPRSSVPAPRIGNNFLPLWPYTVCFVIGV
jgi:hypothetical protein